MRSLQEAKLCSSSRQAKFDIHWHHSVSDIPPSVSEYTMFFAHEFFDALPIHTLQVSGFKTLTHSNDKRDIRKPKLGGMKYSLMRILTTMRLGIARRRLKNPMF